MDLTYQLIAGRIDHALLAPTLTEAEMVDGCAMARRYEVASVCIKPASIRLAIAQLAGSDVAVGTVVGFPHGGQSCPVKLYEVGDSIQAGAREIDMVINIGAVLSGNWDAVVREIEQASRSTQKNEAILKIIFETCFLNDEQMIRLCRICGDAGVDYVKTSTGYGSRGASLSDISLMRQHSPRTVKVKASGGIKNLATAIDFVAAGSDRLGLSATATILDELSDKLGLPRRTENRDLKPPENQPSNY